MNDDDDDLVLSPANGSNQHNNSVHTSNTDVDSIRLEDILNEDSDEGDNNLTFPNSNSNNSINLENDDLINEAREYIRQTSQSPNIQYNSNTSPRTSQILQQILDEDEADDTSQFLEFLKHNNDITDDKQSSSSHNGDVNNLYNSDDAMSLNTRGINDNKANISSTYSNHANDVERSNSIDNRPSRLSMSRAEVEVAMLVKAAPTVSILSPLEVKRRIRKKKKKFTKNIFIAKTDADETDSSINDTISVSKPLCFKNAQFKHNGPGLPTSIAVHSKFLAIGTSHSLIIVFDHFQEVRIVLGDWKKSRDGVVTTIDVSWGSDYLIAGYQSGKIVLWNILNGKEEKILSDAHDCPVVNLRFWPSTKNGLSAASLDIKGRINLLTFNKRLFTWYVDRRCLVNENTGSKIALNVLPPAPEKVIQNIEKKKQDGFKAAFELLIFSSHSSTIIVALNPEPTRLRQWDRPANSDPLNGDYLPCIAVNWGVVGSNLDDKKEAKLSNRGSMKLNRSPLQPIVVRGWGKTIECIKIAVHRSEASTQKDRLQQMTLFETTVPIVALEWSSSNVLVYMNIDYRVCFLNTEILIEMETIDLSQSSLVYATLPKAKPVAGGATNNQTEDSTKTKASLTQQNIKLKGQQARSFFNSIRSCDDDDRLYFLSHSDLRVAKLEKWTDRIRTLKNQGEWIEALLLGLEHYAYVHADDEDNGENDDGNGAEIKLGNNDSHCIENNSKTKMDDRIIADLLMDYVEISLSEDISSASSSLHNSESDNNATSTRQHGPTHIVCEVCMDYCTSIKRNDLLFGPIYERFVNTKQEYIFLELLEKYILCDRVSYVPAIIVQDLITNLKQLNRLNDMEKCVLHLDPRQLDIDGVVRLCAENKLYDALIYIFNNGIMEYAEPIKYIVRELVSENFDGADTSTKLLSFNELSKEHFANKLFSYFCNIMNRREQDSIKQHGAIGTDTDGNNNINNAKQQILKSLFTKHSQYGYLPLVTLLEVDSEQVFDIFSNIYGNNFGLSVDTIDNMLSYVKVLNRVIVDGKSNALMNGTKGNNNEKVKLYTQITKYFSIFISFIYQNGFHATIDMHCVVDSLVDLSTNNMPKKTIDRNLDVKCENAIMNILKTYREHQAQNFDVSDRSSSTSIDLSAIIADVAQFTYQLKELKYSRALAILNEIQGNIEDALNAYLNNNDPQYQQQAFHYSLDIYSYLIRDIDKQPNGNTNTSLNIQNFHSIVLNNLKKFSGIDRVKTTDMIMEIFGGDSQSLGNVLNNIEDPFLQYNCLQQIINSQNSNRKNNNNNDNIISNISRNDSSSENSNAKVTLSPSLYQLYVELLCKFDPSSILSFLKETDGYALDNCLNICKENGVIDATAYLLERTGNIEDALKMLLKFLHVCITNLLSLKDIYANTGNSDDADNNHSGDVNNDRPINSNNNSSLININQDHEIIDRIQHFKEYIKTEETLETLITMLTDNKTTANALWFDVLDMFLNEQRKIEGGTDEGECKKNTISIFIKRLLSAMKGYVSLSDVLMKITKEHRKQPFREFRSTITSMLDNVKYESGILHTVKSILGSSNLKDLKQLHRLKCAAYTEVDFWDSGNNYNNANSNGKESYEEEKKRTRKKMRRYRKRLNIRKKPLFEISERSTYGASNINSGRSNSSRTLLNLQPIL
eukprot:g9275.t1